MVQISKGYRFKSKLEMPANLMHVLQVMLISGLLKNAAYRIFSKVY